MALNKANNVSMTTFAREYARIQKAGGNMDDLCKEVEMNKQSANVKLSQLRKLWQDENGTVLPPLKRCPRTLKDGTVQKEKVGTQAVNILRGLFAESIDETDETDADTDTDETKTDTDETSEETSEAVGSLMSESV